MSQFARNLQYRKFCAYGFLKNLRFFDAFLLLFFINKGLSFTQIGVLYATREIIINLLEIPSGIVADTYGRKSALIGAFGAYILSFITFYYSGDFWLLLVAVSVYGIGDAFRSGTHKGMIMDYLRLQHWSHLKVDYYGHTRAWSQRGSALSALLAGILVFYDGNLQNIFLYSILPYLANFVNIASYPAALNFSLQERESRPGFRATLGAFWQALRSPRVLGIIYSAAVHSAFLKAVKDYIQPVMVQVALLTPLFLTLAADRKKGLFVGGIYFVIYLLTATASRLSARFAARFPRHSQNMTLFLGFGAGLLCGWTTHLEYWIPALLAFVLIFLVENLRKPILTGAVADEVPNSILASVLSAQAFFSTLITVVLALMMGKGADHFGIGLALLSVAALLLVVTGVMVLVSPKTT